MINTNRCFMNKELALRYFATLTSVLATFFNIQEELTTRLKLCQGVPKVVSEVQDNDEVIPEYHFQRYITPVTNNDVIIDA